MKKKSVVAVQATDTDSAVPVIAVIVQPKTEVDVGTSTEEEMAADDVVSEADEPLSYTDVTTVVPMCSRLFSPSPPPAPTTAITTQTLQQSPISISTGK